MYVSRKTFILLKQKHASNLMKSSKDSSTIFPTKLSWMINTKLIKENFELSMIKGIMLHCFKQGEIPFLF